MAETSAGRPRPKILLLIKSLGLGGAERLLVDSLPYLDRERFDYHLAYIVPWKDTLAPAFVDAGLPVWCLGAPDFRFTDTRSAITVNTFAPARSLRAALLLPRALSNLLRLHKRERFDLIHADLPVAGMLARLVGKSQGVPVVYTEHNLVHRYKAPTRLANRATYSWNKRVFAVSQEVTASLVLAGLEKKAPVTTLANCVPVAQVRSEAATVGSLREELDIPSDHLVVGTVAVLRPQKRLWDWLTVAASIAKLRDDVTFLLVGDGPEMPLLRQQVTDQALASRIRMPGFRADGRRLMALMDVYLMSSEYEGLPIALLEAMALAKPVVATAVGGIPEVVRHGWEGYLTSVGDVDSLALFTLDLLNDRAARQRIGANGALRVKENFDMQKRITKIEAEYHRILAENDKVIGATPLLF